MARRIACALTAIVLSQAARADDLNLDASVKAPCSAPRNARAAFQFSIKTPSELRFLIGTKGTIKAKALSIGDDSFGAATDDALAATTPNATVTVGSAGGSLQVRLVVGESSFCDGRVPVSIVYALSDAQSTALPLLRVHIKAGAETETSWSTSGRRAVLRAINDKWRERLGFFLTDEFLWYGNLLRRRAEPENKQYRALHYCTSYCSAKKDFSVTRGLATLLDSVDPALILPRSVLASALPDWPRDVSFPALRDSYVDRVLRISYGTDTYIELGEEEHSELESTPDGLNTRYWYTLNPTAIVVRGRELIDGQ